jgi:hypothetical protein
MPVISVKAFNGVSPKTPARQLQDTQAQTAKNCDVFRGTLRPMKGLGGSVASVSAGSKYIYKFGQDSVDESAGWLSGPDDVDVVRGQIAGDTEEWTYYTGYDAPKAIRAGFTTSPIPMGMPAPATALTATAGTPPDNADELAQETRVYTYTYVNKVGARSIESAPAPAAPSVDVVPGQTVDIIGITTPPSGQTATHVRIYRSTSGTFLFTVELTLASAIGGYTDDVDPELLAEEVPSLFWLPPPDDLAGLINLPNGVMAGFVSRDIYFSEPYVPHAWPDAYSQSIDFPIIGLGAIDTTLVVLTKGTPYFIQGSHPDSMVVVKSDIEQACVSKRSIVSFNNAVFYASPDGLVMLSSGGSQIITLGLFTRDQWQATFKPESIYGYHHDNKYIGFYNNDTDSGSFVFDFDTKQFAMHELYTPIAFQSLRNDKLYVLDGANIKPWQEGNDLNYEWKSKLFTAPRPTNFGSVQVEAEAYPVTFKVYVDGALLHTQSVASRLPFRLPATQGRDWQFVVTGSEEIFSVAMATTMSELTNV